MQLFFDTEMTLPIMVHDSWMKIKVGFFWIRFIKDLSQCSGADIRRHKASRWGDFTLKVGPITVGQHQYQILMVY